ncbi:hypothetical protein F0U62_25445 [Cystobacter fuscus]|uniref:M91 family zinc metallopeptidase n=1 Tax=Cystobacter fuscus TaxID=43 RepID=UPI002B27ED23|nr:hypothetical protein F0U62_25445 [Cystobacter fuscus]
MTVKRRNSSPPLSTTSTARSAPTSPTSPTTASAPTQSTSAPAPAAPPPVTDSLAPAAKQGSVNLTGTPARPAPAAPPLPRAPVYGQRPSNAGASTAREQVHEQIKNGEVSLKPADHGVVHPDLPGIRTRRNPFAQPQEFADFTRDARASTHRLMEVPTGQEMLTDINNKTEQLNPGATGTPQKPLTAVDIHSGNKMTHNPRVSAFASDADKLAESRPAYRFDGKPGTGAASTVKYNPNGGKIDSTDVALRPGDFRANSLGHEMVHAHRAAHGVQVAPLEASKHAQHPALKPFEPETPGGVNYPKEIINQHALLKEEFETVGLQRTPGNPDAPTENKIRKELGMPPRKDYSGAVPGGANHQELLEVNKHVKNGLLTRLTQKEPPVAEIVNHLEK